MGKVIYVDPPARIDGDLFLRLQENEDARRREWRRELVQWLFVAAAGAVVGSIATWLVWR